MAKDKEKVGETRSKHDFSKPAVLDDPYVSEEAEIVSKRSVASIGEAHLTKNKENNERFIRLVNRYQAPFAKKATIGRGFNVYSGDSLSKLIEVIRGFAKKLGWKPTGLGNEELDGQSEAIATEISKKDARITELEEEIKREKNEKAAYIEDINKKHEEELVQLKKDAEKIKNLDNDLKLFRELITYVSELILTM